MIHDQMMSTEPTLRRRAKEAYLTAEELKDGPFDSHEALLARLQQVSQEVCSLSDEEIDNYIGRENPPRLAYFNRAQWELSVVDLSKCRVWERMGRRPWATGRVTAVAKIFSSEESKDSRIGTMLKFSDFFSSHLPIIAFITGASQFDIHDGSHRAVAMVLAGRHSASAWIGCL